MTFETDSKAHSRILKFEEHAYFFPCFAFGRINSVRTRQQHF